MELFKIENQDLKKVDGSNFELERELQNLIENNLELTLGIQFVASEFVVGKYRLDTVGFDQSTDSFVIVEYKRSSKYSVIDQGFAYLNTLLNHKADFALVYNEQFQAKKGIEDFDWTQVKVIFVAGGFSAYQMDAINNPDLPIELFEAKKYRNNHLSLNQILRPSNLGHFAHNSNKKAVREDKGVNLDNAAELIAPNEERLVAAGSESIQNLYQKMKDALLEWDSSFEIKPTSKYIGFRINQHKIVDFLLQKQAMKMWINLPMGELKDPKNLIRDVSETGHWGNGDYEIRLENDSQLEYVLSLVKQVWQKYSHS
ncbi:DUF5655 domain-containing protein [Secundilactobacillus malefermentans]|uniref:DUF5655 domain-containing protein n=1 Tax=Secundilactobacillus malefermentans TaxID=176292 RepID=A0A4R5NII7_9LACO|nr:DUF5655 domain-containing protein [Secundilactobacillus malefermentans]KRM59945.1 hypothetical protein FD44_GL001006 [Secundilactobacillus malefermentans DSM 5705 = KCTC 3548]QEA31505.1 transporter [Secundilactobacillus malefermentans]TDG74399.1 hypothetical protein C5L31_000046 [Secundilactobacillus malefermentans]